MSAHARKTFLSTDRDQDPGVTGLADESALPDGWQAPSPRSRAAYRRTDGAEVFFDRRSRTDDPLDSLSPGWNWLARRPEGTMLGHGVAGPVGGAPAASGLFLPRKFKTALEAMRALDRDQPPRVPVAADADGANARTAAALANLEARGGEFLGADGALIPRVGLTWAQVIFEAPLLVGILPAARAGDPPRGALVEAREAAIRGLAIVLVGQEEIRSLRRLVDRLVAAPSAAGAGALREFLDFLVAGAATPAAVTKQRKRIPLKAAA